MPFEIQIAVAKTHKYAKRESGDTVELVERPAGGLSVVLVDGQGSGQAAKSLSLLVSAKAVALLKDGARDGAVARVVHDYLHTFRQGRVSSTLEILSVDLVSRTVVSSRNSATPILLRQGDEYELRPSRSESIGIRRHTKPAIDEFAAEPGLRIALFSDGIIHAGERYRQAVRPPRLRPRTPERRPDGAADGRRDPGRGAGGGSGPTGGRHDGGGAEPGATRRVPAGAPPGDDRPAPLSDRELYR